MQKRIREWLLALHQTGEGDGSIFVGHSLFFKSMFEMFSGDLFKQSNPTLHQNATTKKLMNCGCVMVLLDFSEINPKIVASELLFGSEWEDEGHAKAEASESPPLTPVLEPHQPPPSPGSVRMSFKSNRLSCTPAASPAASPLKMKSRVDRAEWESSMDYNYNESTPKHSPEGASGEFVMML